MTDTDSQAPSSADNDELSEVLDLVRGALGNMGLAVTVDGKIDGRFLRLNVGGKDAPELVTGTGAAASSQVLDALQLIAMRRQPSGESGRTVIIDAGDFRDRRLGELEGVARRLGDMAAERNETVRIWGMNSFDRRAVHMAIKDRRDVRTDSEGDGVFRVLCVSGQGGSPAESSPAAEE